MDSPVERKLTTIFSADAVGYSRLMSEDEPTTLATLKASRTAMDSLIAGNGGRIVNTAGDSVLAEFGSVVKAVECAIAVQREVAERNAGFPEDRRMWFRIGINLGDVMMDSGDLFGDGVNIAARLQSLAEPGGILVSGTVHSLVRDKLSVDFDYLGAKPVKNIASEIPIYRVLLNPSDAPKPGLHLAQAQASAPVSATFRHRLAVSAAKTGLLIGFLFAINVLSWEGEWWFQWPALPILVVFAWRAISLYQNERSGVRT
jgi:adenylate cyclase